MSVKSPAAVFECDYAVCDSLEVRTDTFTQAPLIPDGWFLVQTSDTRAEPWCFCSAQCLYYWSEVAS